MELQYKKYGRFFWLILLLLFYFSEQSHAQEQFNPKKARVIVICLAQYAANADLNNFSTNDRLDTDLVKLFIDKGVPKQNITFLMDKDATLTNIQDKVQKALRESQSDETLIFYVGSHGGYNAKQQKWVYYTYEGGALNFSWVLQVVNDYFKGKKAILLSDSCYSGGLVALAKKQKSTIEFAVLSSAYEHNVAYSGWRFIEVLLRAFSGNGKLDLDRTGQITLNDLFHYTQRHMAFVAEGMPMFWASPGFDPNYILSSVTNPIHNQQIGQYEEVLWDNEWYKAEIIDVRPNQHYVHYIDYPDTDNAWVDVSKTRTFHYPVFTVGKEVSVHAKNNKGLWSWYPAKVIQRNEWMYLVHYDNYSTVYDEWVGPSRIRSSAP